MTAFHAPTDDILFSLIHVARADRLPGWDGDLCGARRIEDLPDAARRYVERIEAIVEVPVEVVSVGPGRDQTIARIDPFRD